MPEYKNPTKQTSNKQPLKQTTPTLTTPQINNQPNKQLQHKQPLPKQFTPPSKTILKKNVQQNTQMPVP